MTRVLNLFKLRIGVAIAFAAAAGLAVESGAAPGALAATVLVLSVLVASAAAGAFNQYAERDLDARMGRTPNRPYVTGAVRHGPFWLWVIGAMPSRARTCWKPGVWIFLPRNTDHTVISRYMAPPTMAIRPLMPASAIISHAAPGNS